MTRSTRLSLAILAIPFALAAASCGDSKFPGNTLGPGATPTPTPTPTPAPTPTPTPSFGATSCTLPARPDCGNSGCCNDTSTRHLFEGEIVAAQDNLRQTRPDIFNPNGSLRLDEIEYTDLLALRLMQMNPGMCARGGGANGESISKDEVAIKVDNNLSQNVDVIIGSSHSPWVGARHTCRPASF